MWLHKSVCGYTTMCVATDHKGGPRAHPSFPEDVEGKLENAKVTPKVSPKDPQRTQQPKTQRNGRRVAKVPRTNTAAQRRFRCARKIYQNICVLLSKVVRDAVGLRRERTDPHQVPRLRTKIKRQNPRRADLRRRRLYI